MKFHLSNHESLFYALEARGWIFADERLYSPKRTFWIEGTENQSTPLGMLLNMGQRMKVVLENLRANKPAHLNSKQHQDWVSDMESLVNTIEAVIENPFVE